MDAETGLPEAARIAFEDLSSLDLDDYEGMSVDEIGARLRTLARRATPSQLQAVLHGPGSVTGEGRDADGLVERYVARRLDAVRRLRDLRNSFRIPDPER